MWFSNFLKETVDYKSREVIIKRGEVLYHGTIESYDTRKISVSPYDEVFWTVDDLMIARTYIPARSSHLNTSVNSIMRDEQNEDIRKSIGLTDAIRRLAFEKEQKGYQNLLYWEKAFKDFSVKNKEYERNIDSYPEDFFDKWMDAEQNYKKAQREWITYENFIKRFIIYKMKSFGYIANHDYFTKIMQDSDGNLLPASERSVGKVLKITCGRDFKVYNYAYQREGDLMDVDYHKVNLFRKTENAGYDGIIINDYAQSEYHGNYGHWAIGFFEHALKDLQVKQIRNQTHPQEKDWKK